jgi:phosphatidylinositol alpha-1,6-mannosyltransferase
LQALPGVIQAVPELVYLMAGLPEQGERLQALVENLRIAENVRFAGAVSQAALPGYYNLADLFVMLSRPAGGEVEGFGIAVVEAALCGVPAIVSSHGGLPETVLPGETGLVVPHGDPQAAAQAILRLLSDEPLRQRMAEQARRHALEKFASGQMALAYHQALQRLLSN